MRYSKLAHVALMRFCCKKRSRAGSHAAFKKQLKVFRFPSRGTNSRLTPERVFWLPHDARVVCRTVRKHSPKSRRERERRIVLLLAPLLDKLSLRVILLEMSEFNNDAIQPDPRGIGPRLSKPKILAGARTPGQYDKGTPIDF